MDCLKRPETTAKEQSSRTALYTASQDCFESVDLLSVFFGASVYRPFVWLLALTFDGSFGFLAAGFDWLGLSAGAFLGAETSFFAAVLGAVLAAGCFGGLADESFFLAEVFVTLRWPACLDTGLS